MRAFHTTPGKFENGVFKMFSVHTNPNPAFSHSSCLKTDFLKLRFRDGLVWTVGLTLRSQISPVLCETRLRSMLVV